MLWRPAHLRRALFAALVMACAVLEVPGADHRFATTVEELSAYPVFFHGQTVRVRGVLEEVSGSLVLAAGDAQLAVAGPVARGLQADKEAEREIVGLFLDAGRTSADDPRVTGTDVGQMSQARLGKPWPGVNELPLIIVQSAAPGPPLASTPSLADLAVAPTRFLGQRVTVTGRFRGRNLFAEQPDTPGRSTFDFVLQSADASLWVTNLKPQVQRVPLDVNSRLDTNRWLEVTGTVRRVRHLVTIEGTSVRLVPSAPPQSEPVVTVPVTGPPPEVVFSAPTNGETDVPPTSRVRIQFSRDMDVPSLTGRVRASYRSPGGSQSSIRPIAITARYDEGSRVLELRFSGSLEPFGTVVVDLLDGIQAFDHVAMKPWSLTFTTAS